MGHLSIAQDRKWRWSAGSSRSDRLSQFGWTLKGTAQIPGQRHRSCDGASSSGRLTSRLQIRSDFSGLERLGRVSRAFDRTTVWVGTGKFFRENFYAT